MLCMDASCTLFHSFDQQDNVGYVFGPMYSQLVDSVWKGEPHTAIVAIGFNTVCVTAIED